MSALKLRPSLLGQLKLMAVGTVVLLIGLTGVSASPADVKKLDAALQREVATAKGPTRVILRVQPDAIDSVCLAVEEAGGRVLGTFPSVGAIAISIDRSQLERLASWPEIGNLSSDAVVQSPGRDHTASGEWLDNTLLPTLGLTGNALTGDGVGVAVIDSGVAASGDLTRLTTIDFVSGRNVPTDDFGHGTHVAGLVAGTGAMSGGRFRGVAPKARLISLKVLAGDGTGLTSAVLQAIDYAIQNRDALGIDIINLSLGHPIFEPAATDPLVQAVEAAARAGIVVVVSAGNAGINPATGLPGYAGILSPANAPSAITVGAVNTQNTAQRSDDVVPGYSSRGPTFFDTGAKPDLVAPGHNLVSAGAFGSTLYKKYPERQVSITSGAARYLRLSGTSMSAAVTSGVVALMLEAGRTNFGASLSPNAIKAMLQYSALKLPDTDSLTQGAGALNAAGAVELAQAINPTRPAGRWWLESGVNPVSTIGGETLGWSQSFLWGNTVVWGNAVFFNLPVWWQTVVWGNSDFGTVVWGNIDWDTVVWGNSGDDTVVWGNNDWDTVVWGNTDLETVVWGNSDFDTVVWGNSDLDTVVWGNNLVWFDAVVIGNTVVWGNTTPQQ